MKDTKRVSEMTDDEFQARYEETVKAEQIREERAEKAAQRINQGWNELAKKVAVAREEKLKGNTSF